MGLFQCKFCDKLCRSYGKEIILHEWPQGYDFMACMECNKEAEWQNPDMAREV